MKEIKKITNIFSKMNKQVEEKNNQPDKSNSKSKISERLELKFWNEMRNVNPRNDRMEIYAEKIRKGLIYKGDLLKMIRDEEDKMEKEKREREQKELEEMEANLNQRNQETIANPDRKILAKKEARKRRAIRIRIFIALLILIIIAAVVLLFLILSWY